MAKGSSDYNSADDRSSRLQQVMDAYRLALDEGTPVDDDALCRQHADLMPELRIQIRMLRRIRGIDPESDLNAPSRLESDFDDSDIRRFLQENLDQYTIQDTISRGGQGLVFRAIQVHTHRDVAIKVLADGVFASKQQLERFMREIELAARLRHPNIVSIHDSGTVQNRPYCVMEFVDGVPIDDHVLLEQPNLQGRIALFAKICRAVSYAHQRGVIHRDLKPANILVDNDGEPRLLDFGLAKDVFANDASGAGLSMPGQVIGTLQYLSPEQIRGLLGEIDVRTDIYALGLVFYHVLTGAFPYLVEGNYDAVRRNILECTPMPFKSLPQSPEWAIDLKAIDADVEAILRKALEKDKDGRYQSADAMADDFDRYLRGEIVVARADTRFYVLRKTIRRHRIQLAVTSGFVVLATLAAIVSTTLYWRAARERDRATDASQVAQRIMNRVITAVDDTVSRLAGGQAAQDRIYEGIHKDLEQLARVIQSGGGAEKEKARVNINLGKIAVRMGARDEARTCFHRAVQALSDSPARAPQMLPLLIEAKILGSSVEDDPMQDLATAIELAESQAEVEPDEVVYRVLLCEAQTQLARHRDLSGDKDAAVVAADRALAIFGEFDASSPYYSRLIPAAVNAHKWGAGARTLLGDCEAAEDHLLAALDLLDELIGSNPADYVARHQRTRVLLRLSAFAKSKGEIEIANAVIDDAIVEAETLTRANPGEITWFRSLINAYFQLVVNRRRSDPMAARRALAESEKKVNWLREVFSGDARFRESEALILVLEGLLEQEEGNDSESAERLINAAAICRGLIDEQIPDVDAEGTLAYCLGRLGKIYRILGMPSDAEACLAEAVDIRFRQLTQEPQSLDLRLRLIEARYDMIRLSAKTGDEAARRVARSDLKEIESDVREILCDPSNRCQYPLINLILDRVQGQLREVGGTPNMTM